MKLKETLYNSGYYEYRTRLNFMKTTIAILMSSFLSFSCIGQNSIQDLKKDKIITEIFEENDFNSLLLILNLYDSWVTKQTGISDIDSAYRVFCKNAKYNENMEEYILKTKLPQNQLDSIILKCDASRTFQKLWFYNFMKKPAQIDTFEFVICPNLDWKYGEFLKKLQKKNKDLTIYIESIEATGEITPSVFLGLPWSYKKFDFNKMHVRLFYSLHFITANYIVEYHKINP